MTRNFTFLLAAIIFAVIGVSRSWAQPGIPADKIITIGDNATSLQDGVWYLLFNSNQANFVKEEAENILTVTDVSPDNGNAQTNAGYLVQLIKQGDNRYLIQSGLGNYYNNMVVSRNKGTSSEPDDLSPYTITPIEGTNGHFTLHSTLKNGSKVYMQSNAGKLTGSMSAGGANTTRDWVFKTVKLSSADELTGEDYVNYILNKCELVRLTNRRCSNYNVADNGTKTLGEPIDENSTSQVWILEKRGEGYTFRNGKTGRYLNDDDNFRSPSNAKNTLYVQFSPNNAGTSSWINISEDQGFNGNVCLNENGDTPENLFKWAAKGDAGSDWVITEVKNFTKQQIIDELLANSKYKVVEDGRIYHIVNMGYGSVMYENTNGNQVRCQGVDGNKFSQYWRMIQDGDKYYLQNVLSERYLRRQKGSLSNVYTTTESKSISENGFGLNKTDNETEHTYTIVDNNNVGLHCDAGSNLVGWYTDNGNSVWGFEVVDITDEDIAEARKGYLEYEDLRSKLTTYNAHMKALFSDLAFTTLKPDVDALSDEQLAENTDYAALTPALQKIVLKVKHDDWQQFTNKQTGYTAGYEKFFRIADYQVYSNHDQMASSRYADMSNPFGRLSNPTGISGYSGDIIYLFVDGEVSDDCTLAVETVTGTSNTGSQIKLKSGMNVIMLGDQSNLYIFYQLNNPEKYLADYHDIKIHIEGGGLNGYWDATRGMTNADWKLLQQDLLKASPVLNLKTEHLVFCMDAQRVMDAEPNEMEGLMRVWNRILANEERYMGLEDFAGRLRNIWNCFSVDHNYMYATTYGTYYHWNTLGSVMNYRNMTRQGEGNEGGGLWGPSHEMGHNHQKTINVVGAMESSNNMFSNINVFEQGVSTTRYRSPIANFEKFNEGATWLDRDISITTRMYFQLYLYFHAMKNDTTFLPRLFRELRKRPINRHGTGYDGSLSHGENHGGYPTKGSEDYLHLAKVICDVAQADMSEFFEAYGMFVPVKNRFVGDYSNFFVTTTQEEIDEAKAYMKKYPRKLNNLMFIDDHIATSQKANSDNIFEAVPASNGMKVNCCTYAGSKMGTAGDVGMYTDFKSTYENSGYCYTFNKYTRRVTIKGEGAVGFKVYDIDGNLSYLSNNKAFTLPKELVEKGFVIKAAEGNNADIVVPKLGEGVAVDVYYSGQPKSRLVYTDGQLLHMPENAVAVVQSEQEVVTPEALKAVPNVVDETGKASLLIINGNLPWNCPMDIQAGKLTFTKDAKGYSALKLPFDVSTTEVPGLQTVSYSDEVLTLSEADNVPAGQPAVFQGPINLTRMQAFVNKGNYAQEKNINVLSEDGQSVLLVENASPFTYNIVDGTAITEVGAAGSNASVELKVYDLQGRQLKQLPVRKGIYLINGKKVLVK